MPTVPLLGRLSWREYVAVVLSFTFLAFESVIRATVFILPRVIIDWFHDRSRSLYNAIVKRPPKSEEDTFAERIRTARDFGELCALFGYDFEEHVVLTKDGYLLGLHRISSPKGEKRRLGMSTGKPVVYLHHGLLMNSEVWVCLNTEERSLPFVLAASGYDVWLGNNRGNKYSKKSIHHAPSTTQFWDFSLDDFAWYDIPDAIEYVLDTTKVHRVGYVGFSQGTAQAFAALSIHPRLNDKVSVFIALAPALSPAGLAAPIVDGLMKASPTLMYLFFGRRSILSSVLMWQSMLYPPIFTSIIDAALSFLFDWRSANITRAQKHAAYGHLYSLASTKAVVHWFQIMRNAAFHMYDDDVLAGRAQHPVKFPTKNITAPIVLLWGDSDGLVDIESMRAQLPGHTRDCKLEGYEHLDVLWGRNVHEDVIPVVLDALREAMADGVNGLEGSKGGLA